MKTQCSGSYAPASKEFDNVVIFKSPGRWAVGTCPVCGCRVGVGRPTKAQPRMEFNAHNISARRLAASESR